MICVVGKADSLLNVSGLEVCMSSIRLRGLVPLNRCTCVFYL